MASKVFLIACTLALSLETVLAANMACVNLKDSFMAKGVEAADLVRSPVKGKSRNLGSVRFHILNSFFSRLRFAARAGKARSRERDFRLRFSIKARQIIHPPPSPFASQSPLSSPSLRYLAPLISLEILGAISLISKTR